MKPSLSAAVFGKGCVAVLREPQLIQQVQYLGFLTYTPFVVRTGIEPVLSYILSGCQLNVFQSIITLPIASAT